MTFALGNFYVQAILNNLAPLVMVDLVEIKKPHLVTYLLKSSEFVIPYLFSTVHRYIRYSVLDSSLKT